MAALFLILPALFFFSPTVEKNRVVTIQRALVITQERKTPAYYLYQQVQNNEAPQVATPMMTTYLSTQSYVPSESVVAVTEMKVNRREIASDVDAGFQSESTQAPLPIAAALNEAYAIAQPTQPANLSPAKKWATIRGKFELVDGVGVVDHFIEIKRVEEGQVREIGRIDLQAGTYSIDIESPQGTLRAQIVDRNGVRIGSDEKKLVNLQSRGGYYEGPFIRVGRPAYVGNNPILPPSTGSAVAANGRAFSKASTLGPVFSTTLFSNQHTLEKPTDIFANISRDSSTVTHLSDANSICRTIVSIRQTSDQTETPVFTNKWIQGVLEYVSDQQKIEFKSQTAPILMGRVFIDDKAVAGAQVQIENHPGLYPIYFDQFMIPNFKQTETSENGYFMFVGLEEDTYSVAAFKNNKMLGYQMFVSEEDAISYQNIVSSSIPRQAVVRSFDAFTGAPVEADLIIPDEEEIIQTTNGTAAYRTFNRLGVAMFQARTNQTSYVPVRYFQDARKDFTHIPMVDENWLKQMQTAKLINDEPNTGTIIGFVPELEYEMYLAKEDYKKNQIVYFDQHGQISAKAVSGGGFILFNVPVGASEVIVQENNSDRIYSQVFDVKISQLSAAHFSE